MQNKLTLRIDEKLIAKAKAFAKSNGKSVSQIVADYFNLLDKKNKELRKRFAQKLFIDTGVKIDLNGDGKK